MQSPTVAVPFASARSIKLSFGLLGLRKRDFGSDRNVRIELRIKPLNPCKHHLRKFYRRKLPLAEQFPDFLDRCEGNVAVGHEASAIKRFFRDASDSRRFRCSQ